MPVKVVKTLSRRKLKTPAEAKLKSFSFVQATSCGESSEEDGTSASSEARPDDTVTKKTGPGTNDATEMPNNPSRAEDETTTAKKKKLTRHQRKVQAAARRMVEKE